MNYGLSLISYYEVIYDPGTHHRNNPKSYENLLDNKYSRGACSCYFHKKNFCNCMMPLTCLDFLRTSIYLYTDIFF